MTMKGGNGENKKTTLFYLLESFQYTPIKEISAKKKAPIQRFFIA